MFDDCDDRFFDLSYGYPAEIVPNRSVCGMVFDPDHRYTRVRATHDEFWFEIQVGFRADQWAIEELHQKISNEYYLASLTPHQYREAFGEFLAR